MTYDEKQKLKHRVRQLESTVGWLQAKLDRTNSILSEHKLGPYKYTTTPEKEWQRRLDVMSNRLRMQGEMAAERIRCAVGEHEVIEYKYGNGKTMELTHGILFDQLKKEQEEKNDKNIRTRDGSTNI